MEESTDLSNSHNLECFFGKEVNKRSFRLPSFRLPEDLQKHPLIVIPGFVIAFATAWIAWMQRGIMQKDYDFERYQRAVETIASISNSWEDNFESNTRRSFIRFIVASRELEKNLESKKITDEDKKEFFDIFADESNIYLFTLGKCKICQLNDKLGGLLFKLLETQEIGRKWCNNSGNTKVEKYITKISEQVSLYRNSLVSGLNILETVALMKNWPGDNEIKELIDSMYLPSLKERPKDLIEFVGRYRYHKCKKNKNENYTGWKVLYPKGEYSYDEHSDKCSLIQE